MHPVCYFFTKSPPSSFSSYAGFRKGCQYQLTFEQRGDGTVAVVLDHQEHVSEGAGPLVVQEAEFEKW